MPPESLRIANEFLSLSCLPKLGGSILDLQASLDGNWASLLRLPPHSLKSSSDSACFIMAPYPNRVRDARFVFEGCEYQLANPEKHAIHGCVRNRPWEILSVSGERVELGFRSENFPDVDFPFAFRANLVYKLDGPQMIWELSIQNLDQRRMPVGCGFHPYFRSALRADEQALLQFKARGYYPTHNLPLPSGEAVAITPELDFSKAKLPPSGLDHCLSGWEGDAQIHWPLSRALLKMEASPELGHLVIYTPASQECFALEPQSQANDGFNLLAQGVSGTGVKILEPGDTFRASVRFTVMET